MILSVVSCYDPQEGCLDPLSANYDIDGDNSCEGCCQYPALAFAIAHYNGAESFAKGDTILTAQDSIVLLDFVYTLNNVRLINTESTIQVLDTTTLSNEDIIVDDIIKVKPSGYVNSIGKFRYEGNITQLKFDTGLPGILKTQSLINDTHPLNSTSDSLYYKDKYYQQRLKIARGRRFTDTIQIDLPVSYGSKNYAFSTLLSTKRGDALSIKLRADYSKWFRGIDVTQSPEVIGKGIFANQNDFISLD